jgi:acetyl esterase/lipase
MANRYWDVVSMAVRARLSNRRRGSIVERRVDYGADPRQHVLFMYETHPATPRRDIVCFIHGGAWTLGSPEDYRFIGQHFARLGFPTIMVGYRLAPRAKFHDQLDDVFVGLEAGLKMAEEHGFHQREVIVAGQSAGSHLGSLLVYDREAQAEHHVDQNMFAGLATISGPLDFAGWQSRTLRGFFSNVIGEGDWETADPIRHLTGDENIPVWCVHGDRDTVVPFANSQSFAERVNVKSPGLAELVTMRGAHHSDVMALFVRPLPETRALTAWLTKVDARGAGSVSPI